MGEGCAPSGEATLYLSGTFLKGPGGGGVETMLSYPPCTYSFNKPGQIQVTSALCEQR